MSKGDLMVQQGIKEVLTLDNVKVVDSGLAQRPVTLDEKQKQIFAGILHIYNAILTKFNYEVVGQAVIESSGPYHFELKIKIKVPNSDGEAMLTAFIDPTDVDNEIVDFEIEPVEAEYGELKAKFDADDTFDEYRKLKDLEDDIERYYKYVTDFSEHSFDNCSDPSNIRINNHIFYVNPEGEFGILCRFIDLYVIAQYAADYIHNYDSIEELVKNELLPATEKFLNEMQSKGLPTDENSQKTYLAEKINSQEAEKRKYGKIDTLLAKGKYGTLEIHEPNIKGPQDDSKRPTLNQMFDTVKNTFDTM